MDKKTFMLFGFVHDMNLCSHTLARSTRKKKSKKQQSISTTGHCGANEARGFVSALRLRQNKY